MSSEKEHRGGQPRVSIDPAGGIGPPPTMCVSPRGKSGANLAAILPGSEGDDDAGTAAEGITTTTAGSQRSKFVRSSDISDDDIADTDVVVPKTKRGTEGTKDYNSIMKDATAALSTKFGVAKHMIVTPDGAESPSGNNIKSVHIQHSILQLILRSHEAHQRCKRYDFMSILLIPNFKIPSLAQIHPSDPSEWWDESETNLWEDWDKVTERQATSW